MPDIEVALVTLAYAESELASLVATLSPAEVCVIDQRDRPQVSRILARADVALLRGLPDGPFYKAPKLRWIHCDHAGIEGAAHPEIFNRGIIVSGSAGRSAPALAEHALFFMFSLNYGVAELLCAQRERRWSAATLDKKLALKGRALGIVGMGHTERALAVRAKALGMRILGYRRQDTELPQGVDELYSTDRGESLTPLLEQSDFVVLAVSLSNATCHLIGAESLERMKTNAFLINIARGALVDEGALASALRHERIAGAGLDTFSVEPLPRWHPLWRTPNTIITPHRTPPLPDRARRSLEIIAENVRRYRDDKALLNQLSPRDVYTPVVPRQSALARVASGLRHRFRAPRRTG